VVCVCVCHNLYPLEFIAGSHRVRPLQPTWGTYEEAPCGLDEAVGPTGQVGRPGRSVGLPGPPTAPSFFQQAILGCLVLIPLVLACLEWFELGSWATLGPFEPESSL
jgi:hypothetical protein